MKKSIPLLFLTLFVLVSCATPVQVNNVVKEQNKIFWKYTRLFEDDARYPIGWLKGFEVIKADFGYSVPADAFASCWLSSEVSNRQIVVNLKAWNNPHLFRRLETDDYRKQDIFNEMTDKEYSRYKLLLYAYSACYNTVDNNTLVVESYK